jgi:hypothetical protein
MSIPLLFGLIAIGVVIAAAAGVWRARNSGPAGGQSAIVLLLVAVVAAGLVWMLVRR